MLSVVSEFLNLDSWDGRGLIFLSKSYFLPHS